MGRPDDEAVLGSDWLEGFVMFLVMSAISERDVHGETIRLRK